MPIERNSRQELRVLLVPATRRDGEAITKVMQGVNIDCDVCSSITVLCEQLKSGASVILVAEESLKSGYEELIDSISNQPVWSDMPIIVLSRSGAELPTFSSLLRSLGNVSVLERPVRVSTLLSVVQSSIRARLRQYQSRDHFAERELLLASERHARGESERASRIKDEFLATLSHELRTPLSAILGWAQILAMYGSEDATVSEGVKVIERNARAQTQIIEDLLDMSRIISGKIRLDVRVVDLAEVARSAIDTVRPAAEAKNIQIQAVYDPLAPDILGDPGRLQQVVWNLLSNAVKFTPNGGTVQILLEQEQSQLTFRVVDSGVGIEAKFLPYVFDRFRQADATTTRQHGGLGLGLAIAKQLVELHGGSIRADSKGAGQGSSFIFSLPIRTVHNILPEPHEQSDLPAQLPEPNENMNYSLAGIKVLVVDDEPDARNLLKRLLEDKLATVCACESTHEAMEMLKVQSPDLIISDIGMPHEDGYSFIRRVRSQSDGQGGNTPAIALTAYARAQDHVTAIRAGFQRHLAKPVEPKELFEMVATLVQGRTRQ